MGENLQQIVEGEKRHPFPAPRNDEAVILRGCAAHGWQRHRTDRRDSPPGSGAPARPYRPAGTARAPGRVRAGHRNAPRSSPHWKIPGSAVRFPPAMRAPRRPARPAAGAINPANAVQSSRILISVPLRGASRGGLRNRRSASSSPSCRPVPGTSRKPRTRAS